MSSLGSQSFTTNLTTKTITDVNNQTGLPGQVLTSTANGIDWLTNGSGGEDLQATCTIGNITNTNIVMTAGFLQQDPTINIQTSAFGNAIKIGYGNPSLVSGTISIGTETGFSGQGINSIAIGEAAGSTQGIACVAIGNLAAQEQQDGAVAVGDSAGQFTQRTHSVCLGANAGNDNCSAEAIAIGFNAGFKILGDRAIAIGSSALSNAGGVGLNTIAIGHNAMAQAPQFDNNIILNSTGVSFPDFATFPPTTGGRFYVAFVKKDDGTHTNNSALHYDTDTGEIYFL
jgi:hypothetical protein